MLLKPSTKPPAHDRLPTQSENEHEDLEGSFSHSFGPRVGRLQIEDESQVAAEEKLKVREFLQSVK